MRRNDFPLKTSHVVAFMMEEFGAWVSEYKTNNKPESLFRLVQRLVHRRDFSFNKSNHTLLPSEDLQRAQGAFVRSTATAINATYTRDCIFNADETSVYYKEDPATVIAEKRSKKSAKVLGRKKSSRATISLTVSASERKLKPLIVFKGEPKCTVKNEFNTFLKDAVYAVQNNAWMDGSMWKAAFVEQLWCDHIDTEQPGPLVLYVDNFK